MSQVRKTKEQTYFISGHRDIYPREFTVYYAELIKTAWNEGACFVLGDYDGVDKMAQEYLSYLVDNSLQPSKEIMRVNIFHIGDKPMNNVGGFPTVGGFLSDVERDSAMTDISDEDIAYIGVNRWTSGTAQNILRRYEVPLIEKETLSEGFNWKDWLCFLIATVVSGLSIMIFWNIFTKMSGLGNLITDVGFFTTIVISFIIIFTKKDVNFDSSFYLSKSLGVLVTLLIYILSVWILG